MDLAAVMDEVGDLLDGIFAGRVFRHPPDGAVPPPAAIVTYPESIDFDATFARGMDRIPDLPVIVLVGRVSARAARTRLAAYVAGAGAKSVKATLEAPGQPTGGGYTAFDTLRVTSVAFDIVAFARVEHLAATFTLDIAGTGAS
jgi:hypothetical protein